MILANTEQTGVRGNIISCESRIRMAIISCATRCWLLILLAAPVPGSRETAQKSEQRVARAPELQSLMNEANESFRTGDRARALAFYRKGLERSKALSDTTSEACFLAGAGNIYVLTHQYREALQSFTSAAEAARRAGHQDLRLRVGVSLASLYRRLGDKPAGAAIFRELTAIFPAEPPPWLLLQAGNIKADEQGIDAATPYFLAAVDAAGGDAALKGTAWTQLGYLSLSAGRLSEADRALTEGFRIRRLARNKQAENTLFYIGMLRLAQGDAAQALRVFEQLGRVQSPVAPPFLHYQRARALAALGRSGEAFSAFEQSLAAAADWRLEVPSADSYRISGDTTLAAIYSSYVDTGMAHLRTHRNRRLERRLFEVAEMNRSAGLRETQVAAGELTPRYLRLLDRYRQELRAAAPNAATLARLRRVLAEEEAGSGTAVRTAPVTGLATRIQRSLAAGDTLVTFHSGGAHAWAWAVTRHTLMSYPVPGGESLASGIAMLRRDPGNRRAAESLYGSLFGGMDERARRNASWILSLDGGLHGVPFAALRQPAGGFLAASRSLRIVPGAALLAERTLPAASTQFAAFGDAIYNSADPRRRGTAKWDGRELARLPGSGNEARLSAAMWASGERPRPPSLGTDFTLQAVAETAAAEPAVLHLAAHVVEGTGSPDALSIALGAGAGSTPEFLSPIDIGRWRGAPSLVVLSGCASGTGKALPGAGLIGLTRAWLLAGSRAVLASHWAVDDDSAPFFRRFYQELMRGGRDRVSGRAAARALHIAQSEMARQPGSRPEAWGAYFVVAKE